MVRTPACLCLGRDGLDRIRGVPEIVPAIHTMRRDRATGDRPLSYTRRMDRPRPSHWQRFLEWVGLRKPPPDIGVREPRIPKPSSQGGVAMLERPETDERGD